jgi:hypothetical protein
MARKKSVDASLPVRLDQPSYFQNWERKARSATHSDSINGSRFSSESSHPSPKSTFPPPRVRRVRRNLAERSRSAPTGTIPELGVPTIANLKARRQSKTAEPSDESSVGQKARSTLTGNSSWRRQGSAIRAGPDSKRSSVSSITRRFRNHIRTSLPDFRIPECRIANSARDLFPPRKERPGYEWTKASKKADWVERLISTSGIMQRRSKSADPYPVPIIPLRPPASRNVSGTGYHRTVKMETSFAKLRPATPLEMPGPPRMNPRTSIAARTKSIIVKRVRFALSRGNTAEHISNSKQSPSTPLKSSFLSARNRTAEGLQRVASILHFMAAEIPSRTTSDRSNQAREPMLPTPLKHTHRKGTFHLPAVIRTRTRKSTTVSYTSSIRKMRRGDTPLNTPDPKETYRIKRSRSAETEEFFKIDISVRGGTSYLPSEARRIHTPPLPGDGPGQKRMGFFFDYTAPSPAESPTTENSLNNEREQAHSSAPNVRPRRGRTVGGTDWYEAQLAKVDAVDEARSASRSTSAGLGRSEKDNEKGKEKKVVDLNVPEHLPSSPLCPRHAKHEGRGTGVCWMHGRNKIANNNAGVGGGRS